MNKTLEFVRNGANITNILNTVYDVDGDGTITNTEVLERSPLSFVIDIDSLDVIAGSKVIGTVPANKVILEATISIENIFDGSVTMSIGDSTNHSSVMEINYSDSATLGNYTVAVDSQYLSDTEISIYFTSIGCTMGNAKIIIS